MNRQKLARSEKALNIVTYIILTIVVIFCALPFILVVSGSFSDSALIMKDGYSILPRGFSLDGYRSIFLFPKQIAKAYGISIFVTGAGTCIGLIVMTLCGYALSRSELKYRNVIAFIIYFYHTFFRRSGSLVYCNIQAGSEKYNMGIDCSFLLQFLLYIIDKKFYEDDSGFPCGISQAGRGRRTAYSY